MDLRDLWRGGLSWRRLAVLVRHLPEHSATKTAMRDALTADEYAELAAAPREGYGPWSHTEMLLAGILDAVRVGNYQFVMANLGKGKKPKPPEPVRRPGIDGPSNVRPISAAARELLERGRHQRSG